MATLGIEYVMDQFDIDQTAFQTDPGVVQTAQLELDAEAVLLDGRVFKEGAEVFGRP